MAGIRRRVADRSVFVGAGGAAVPVVATVTGFTSTGTGASSFGIEPIRKVTFSSTGTGTSAFAPFRKLLNYDFETWSAGLPVSWSYNQGGTSAVTQETTIVHGGGSSAKFFVDAGGDPVSLDQTVQTTPGISYTIGFWYYGGRTTATFGLGVQIFAGPSNGYYLQGDGSWAVGFARAISAPYVGNVWTYTEINAQPLPAGATFVNVLLARNDGNLTIYLDDVAFAITTAAKNVVGFTSTGTGTSAFAPSVRRAVAFASTGTGTSAFGRVAVRAVAFSSAGVGTSSFAPTTRRALAFASAGVGTSGFVPYTQGAIRLITRAANSNITGVGSTTMPVNSPGLIPVGATILVTAASRGGGQSPTVADNSNRAGTANTYTLIGSATDAGTNNDVRVFRCKVTRPLLPGDTITATYATAWAIESIQFSAFSAVGSVDVSATATGTTSPMSVGPTATTAQAAELVFMGMALGTGTGTASGYADATSGYTANPRLNTARPSNNIEAATSYKIASSIATQTDAPTATAVTGWAGVVVTLRSDIADLAFASTGTGTSSFATTARRAVAFASTGTGTSAFGRVARRAIAFTSTGVGTSAFAASVKRAVAFSSTGTGTSTFGRVAIRALAFSSTGTGTSSFGVVRATSVRDSAFSSTGTGTSSFAPSVRRAVAFSSTGVGTSSFGRVARRAVAFSSTGTGTSTFGRVARRAVAFASTGTGTSAFGRVARRAITITSAGVGTSTFGVVRQTVFLLGVSPSSSPAQADFTAFNAKIAPRSADVFVFFQAFPAEPVLYSAYYTWCTAAGAIPQSTWQPSGAGIAAAINAGTYDSYIDSEAAGVVGKGRVQIRLAHECNGGWTDYSPASCTDAAYISMFQRIVTRFRAAGATNVEWIWSPNIWTPSAGVIPDPSSRYPGDAYVDWVGLDGYQMLTAGTFRSFRTLFLSDYNTLRALAPSKRFAVSETGEGEPDPGGARVDWLDGLQTTLRTEMTAARALTYFNRDGGVEGDYRIDYSPADLAAFRDVVNTPPFVGDTFQFSTYPFRSDGVGSTSFKPSVRRAVAFSSTGTGTSSFGRVARRALVFSSTGVGTSAFSAGGKKTVVGFTSTGVGTSAFGRVARRAVAFSSTGVGTSAFGRVAIRKVTFSSTGTGTSSFAPLGARKVTFNSTGTGTSAFAAVARRAVAFSSTGTGTSAFGRTVRRAIAFSSTGTGTSSFAPVNTNATLKNVVGFTSTGIGTTTVSAPRMTRAVWAFDERGHTYLPGDTVLPGDIGYPGADTGGIGTSSFAPVARRAVSFASTGTGTSTFGTMLVKRAVAFTSTGVGTTTFNRTVRRALAFTSTGTGTSAFGRVAIRRVAFTSTGVGTSSFTPTRPTGFASVGVGTSTFSPSVRRAVAFVSTGTGTSAFGRTVRRALSVTSTGVGTSIFSVARARPSTATSAGVGTSSFGRVAIRRVAFSSTGAGTSAFTPTRRGAVAFTSAGVGTTIFNRSVRRALFFNSTAIGTSTFVAARRRSLAFPSAGVGTTTMVGSVIVGGVQKGDLEVGIERAALLSVTLTANVELDVGVQTSRNLLPALT